MFSPGLSLVLLAGGETGLPVASVATIGLRLPAFARDMEADIEVAVAGDLLVADLVIYISIIRSCPSLTSNMTHLAEAAWLPGLWPPPHPHTDCLPSPKAWK